MCIFIFSLHFVIYFFYIYLMFLFGNFVRNPGIWIIVLISCFSSGSVLCFTLWFYSTAFCSLLFKFFHLLISLSFQIHLIIFCLFYSYFCFIYFHFCLFYSFSFCCISFLFLSCFIIRYLYPVLFHSLLFLFLSLLFILFL